MLKYLVNKIECKEIIDFVFLGCRQVGLFLGPCFTIFLKQLNFDIFGLPVNVHNSPGLLMAILWIILILLTLCLFFDSPIRIVS